jgi:hypothetical protein
MASSDSDRAEMRFFEAIADDALTDTVWRRNPHPDRLRPPADRLRALADVAALRPVREVIQKLDPAPKPYRRHAHVVKRARCFNRAIISAGSRSPMPDRLWPWWKFWSAGSSRRAARKRQNHTKRTARVHRSLGRNGRCPMERLLRDAQPSSPYRCAPNNRPEGVRKAREYLDAFKVSISLTKNRAPDHSCGRVAVPYGSVDDQLRPSRSPNTKKMAINKRESP